MQVDHLVEEEVPHSSMCQLRTIQKTFVRMGSSEPLDHRMTPKREQETQSMRVSTSSLITLVCIGHRGYNVQTTSAHSD